MDEVQGFAVISSTIYQENGFKDYRFIVSKAASELGFKVLRNSEDNGATQRAFDACMTNDNPIFIAILGEKLTPNVKKEYEMAIKLGLNIITLIKATGENRSISENTQNNLKSISKYIYEKDCSTFLSCEDLYNSVKKRLQDNIKNLRKQKMKLLKSRIEVYPDTTDMICKAKKLVILCQNSSTLLLGPRDGGVEDQCYNMLIDWLQNAENRMTFIHIFSREKTKEELKKNEYTKKRDAKLNLINIMTSPNIKPNIVLRTVEELQPCVVADNNILFSLALGVNTHYIQLPGIFANNDDLNAIINLLKDNGVFNCSNETHNIKKIESLLMHYINNLSVFTPIPYASLT